MSQQARASSAVAGRITLVIGSISPGGQFSLLSGCVLKTAQRPFIMNRSITRQAENLARQASKKKKIVVLGSGPIRIGQGIEFDYCSVHCVWALREAGFEAVIINNNPETVSTDFDISDRLYFEPLTPEDVLNILDREQPEGVIVQ